MMKIKKLLLLFAISIVSTPLFAQSFELSEENKEDIEDQIIQQVDMYQHCLKYLANKKTTIADKNVYYRKALDLFIGKGESYEDLLTHEKHAAVKTQVSSVKKGPQPPIPTKVHLRGIRDGSRYKNYSNVSMESAQLVVVDGLTKIDDTLYTTVAHMATEFVGVRDGVPVYKDITWKDIEVYVVRRETATRVRFDIQFGDITVVATEGL